MIRWYPGGWWWLLQVQKLRCAGHSLCWGPGCWPSGRGPAGSCTGLPTYNIKTSINALISAIDRKMTCPGEQTNIRHLHLWLSRLWPSCPGTTCRAARLLPTSHRWPTECDPSGSSHSGPTRCPKYVLSRLLSCWPKTDTPDCWWEQSRETVLC